MRCVDTVADIYLELRNMWSVCLHLSLFSSFYPHDQIGPSDRLRGVVTLQEIEVYKHILKLRLEGRLGSRNGPCSSELLLAISHYN